MNEARLRAYLEACAELKLLLPKLTDVTTPPRAPTWDEWAEGTGRVVTANIPAQMFGAATLKRG